MGTVVCDTPSQVSITLSVVRTEAYKNRTVWAATLQGGHVERHKHDLRHALSVTLGVQKSLREQNGDVFQAQP